MSEFTIETLEREVSKLRYNQKYIDALVLIEREAALFSGGVQRAFYNWRMCMAALAGDVPYALEIFREAVEDKGQWWGASLHDDPDLKSLQGLPEFERLVQICLQQRDIAIAEAKPVLQTLVPNSQTQPYPWIITLHGNGGNIKNTIDYWRSVVEHGWLLALTQSSQMQGDDTFVWDDREWSRRDVEKHIAELAAQYPIDRSRAVVGGFSMGGGTAIWLAASGAIAVRGFVVVAPWWLDQMDALQAVIESGKGDHLRGVIFVSENDIDCYHTSQIVTEALRARGVSVELNIIPNADHGYPADFEHRLDRALAFVLDTSNS